MIGYALRALYSALMWLAQPLLRLKLARRSRSEPVYAQSVEERFGHYQVPASAGSIWLHAVSLGETRAAVALVDELRNRLPGMRLLVTSGTATGRIEAARVLMQDGDLQVWQPWDTRDAVGRFLRHFRPRIGILMETEMWPNVCAACTRSGTPLVLANARLSARSLRRTQRLAWLARPAYRSLAAVWAQTAEDAARLARVGALVQGVLGNLKFDLRPDPAQQCRGEQWRAAGRHPIIVFASSREGEEAMLLDWLQRQRAGSTGRDAADSRSAQAAAAPATGLRWLIVPRHPQRFDAVAQLIENHGFAVARRSSWAEAGPGELAGTADTIWLGDSLGEMALYFGMAQVALLGGSFAPLGGQNLIEAAAVGCPVVLGPHTFNFAEAAQQAVRAGAAERAPTLAAAAMRAVQIALDAGTRDAMAARALTFVRSHRDASSRTAEAIAEIVANPKPGLTRPKKRAD